MIRLVDLRSDRYGILEAFRDGGYSDDMILGAICNKHGLKVRGRAFILTPIPTPTPTPTLALAASDFYVCSFPLF